MYSFINFIVQPVRENFTINNVVKYLDERMLSKQWVAVANRLGLPKYVILSIKSSQDHSNLVSLRRVVDWWFQATSDPEWSVIEKLVQGIHDIVPAKDNDVSLII
jgi:hypothetical protein